MTQLDTHTHTHTHTHPVDSSERMIISSETATYTTHNKHKRRKPTPSARFETAIPAIERLQTSALDCFFVVVVVDDDDIVVVVVVVWRYSTPWTLASSIIRLRASPSSADLLQFPHHLMYPFVAMLDTLSSFILITLPNYWSLLNLIFLASSVSVYNLQIS